MQRYTVNVAVLPFNEVLTPYEATFRYLDTFTPSSYCLLGSLLTDLFIVPTETLPTASDLARSFWNLMDFTAGNGWTGEVPDTIIESMDVICQVCLKTLAMTRAIYEQSAGPIPTHVAIHLDRFSGYDLLLRVLIPNPGYRYGLPKNNSTPDA